ncbi:MAG: ABC-F family ATP-binding cassette domain-containing protein [Prevotellaceae bacterium]|jgi:ATP-binding cassette subfamily F protein uup|nr:ABC-F family ATP-binding cassette domain-containing protein [Prevotellaceae bacterium]
MVFLQVESLTKSFGDKLLFENISFGIDQGQRVALIARNGAGKTTLLNILLNNEPCDAGSVTYRRNLRIGYLPQNPVFTPDITVGKACFASDSEIVRAIARYEQLLAAPNDELQTALSEMDRLQAWDYEVRIKQILGKLDIHHLDKPVAQLSGGQQKRLALANTLISNPDLLILDEPTNHLDLQMVEWMESLLCQQNITLLMVTHDRYFLDRICTDIFEIDQQKLFHYKGNYAYYLEKRAQRIDSYNAEMARTQNLYRRELDWMRRMPQARATKAQSRIDAFQRIEERASQRMTDKQMSLSVKAAYLGSKIFEAQYVSKSFDDYKILDNFYYNFSRYEKLGIIGKNGTGKTTFLKLLTGEIPPDSGRFDIGDTVVFACYSQSGLAFDERMKVIDVVRDIAEEVDLGGGRKLSVSQFLNHFLFPPEKQHDYVANLCGGERRRLYLCTVLMRNPNFLILDEPTNDLDIATLNVLEDYLVNFKGCVIVVSHDRFFMDRVVDHLLVFEGDAIIKDFPGNYTDYRQWQELAEDVDRKQKTAIPTEKTSKSAERQKAPRTNSKIKLSFNEQREFDRLETEIETLENEKQHLETLLSSGTLENEQLLRQSQRFAEVMKLIDQKSARWFELDERNS